MGSSRVGSMNPFPAIFKKLPKMALVGAEFGCTGLLAVSEDLETGSFVTVTKLSEDRGEARGSGFGKI